MGFTATLVATIFATRLLPYNAITIFGTGLLLAFAVTAALSLIRYDGVPVLGKAARVVSLIVDRKPTVLAREELDRQASANPHAFVLDDTPINAS